MTSLDHIPLKARLYFELHVTVEESKLMQFADFALLAEEIGWRASRFDEDLVDDYHGKWFASARVKDRNAICDELHSAIDKFAGHGCAILRWKAEDTLLDSKHGDTL